MSISKVTHWITIFILLLFVCLQAYAQQESSQEGSYPSAPQVLVDEVRKVVTDIVNYNDVSKLDAKFSDIFLYTVADAIGSLSTLTAYKYISETARTDKQIGASARSTGSTSILEKPGFAQLLSYAIEHGAVQQDVSGTALTLSSSPYAFFAMASGDTAETYEKAGFLKRIGASATFNISNQNSMLEDVNWKQLTEWSLQFRLYGDRSTRSKKFQEFWLKEIKPYIQRRLIEITAAQSLLGEDENLDKLRGNMLNPSKSEDPQLKRLSLRDKISKYLKDHADKTKDEKMSVIEELILAHMKEFLLDPIIKNEIRIDPKLRTALVDKVIPSLELAHKELEQAGQILDQYLTKFNKGPLLTLAYTNHRTTTNSCYSDLKLLFEQDVRPLKLVANAWVALYHNPDPAINQERIRDYGIAISFEGKANNPFAMSTSDLGKVTYSFSGRYQRMEENNGLPDRKANIVVAQLKVEMPIAMGISLPFSFSYASATELNMEKEVRASFGISFDMDKLFALSRKILKPSNE